MRGGGGGGGLREVWKKSTVLWLFFGMASLKWKLVIVACAGSLWRVALMINLVQEISSQFCCAMLFHQIGCICCLLHGLVLECSVEKGLLFETFSKTLWSGDQLNSFWKWCHGVPALVLRAPELSSNNGAVEHQPRHSVPKWWYNNGAPANQQWRWAPKWPLWLWSPM